MNKHIVIINGSGGVGKDEFVKQVRKCFLDKATSYPAVANYSSVEWIKSIARTMGWPGDKSEKSRKFLSDLKDLSTWYSDTPFKMMKEKVENFLNDKYLQVLFLHIREPEEIERAAKEFNAITLLIKNDRIKPVTSNRADAEVNNYKYDHVIYNNGTLDDLEWMAKGFIERLKNEVTQ